MVAKSHLMNIRGGWMKKALLSLLFLIPQVGLSKPAPNSSEFRYFSFVYRDKPPSVQEAKDFASGKPLESFVSEWIRSKSHEERIHRYFNDLFGVTKDIFIAEREFILKSNDSGVYYMDAPGHGDCSSEQATAVSPENVWWLDANEPAIQMCPDTQNSFITQGTWNTASWRNCLELNAESGLFHSDCGCGPKQVLCWPEEHKWDVRDAVRFEFPQRALHVYRNDMTWPDLLGGSSFYGNRFLYHVYIYQSRIVPGTILQDSEPSTADFVRLKQLHKTNPELGPGFIAFPDMPSDQAGQSQERSGIATMPGFLRQNNNFRSRVRALTERLLCEDVGPAQNIDSITTFVNPDLSDFDREHGENEACSSCHFAMDNQGSAILGFGPIGHFQYFWDEDEGVLRGPSQLGHSFGQRGVGPEFLMNTYIEHAPEFHTCMAKTAWEDFSGQAWEGLSGDQRVTFEQASRQGPRALIQQVLESDELLCDRDSPSDECKPKAKTTTELSFSKDIKPILDASCAGSGCHSNDSSLGASYRFIEDEAKFRGISPGRVQDNSMPPPESGFSLSESDRQLILNYLGG